MRVLVRGGALDGRRGLVLAWMGAFARVFVEQAGVFDLPAESLWAD